MFNRHLFNFHLLFIIFDDLLKYMFTFIYIIIFRLKYYIFKLKSIIFSQKFNYYTITPYIANGIVGHILS